MKAVIKDRFKLSLILIFCLFVLALWLFMMFGNSKAKGIYTGGVKIVNVNNTEQINMYKKYKQAYGIKVKDNDNLYLKYNYYESNQPVSSKITLTDEQYNKLLEGTEYWFNIKFTKRGDNRVGTVIDIYTENPIQN